MQKNYTTSRLSLLRLQLTDTVFIKELVNTEGWIKFIGDRNIHNEEAAFAYIEKLLNSSHIIYWVVRVLENNIPVGVVTLIKRDYLPHHDIGFAFLPQHCKNGYAFEAAAALLKDVIQDPQHTKILATTLKNNSNSIHLLHKLGFKFDKVIEKDDEQLLLYEMQRTAQDM